MSSLLVVEDNPETSAAVAALLRRQGHDVTCCGTAGEAVRQLRRDPPNLVVLDLGLPRIDGLELLDALAVEPVLADIPVVVLSGRDDPGCADEARRRGARDYILKGLRWEDVYERIHACLARAAAERRDA